MNTLPKIPRLNSLRKNHSRWAWMAGATAAAAASPGAHAATAQITLVNDNYNQANVYQLSLMVTSGHPFGTVSSHRTGNGGPIVSGHLGNSHKPFQLAASESNINEARIIAGTPRTLYVTHSGLATPNKSFALIPLQITDPNVATGQANTHALLEAEAFNNGPTDQFVALLAVFYSQSGNTTPPLTINSNTGQITGAFTNVGSSDHGVFTSSVPEPSGLGLLALGAGGILARRQRRKAA